MAAEELRNRTKKFALEVIRFGAPLMRFPVESILAKQLIRCSTSVGANLRSASLAQSTADMIAKLKIVEAEADEAVYWLELLKDSKPEIAQEIDRLRQEADELFRIVASSVIKLKQKQQGSGKR